MPGFHKDLVLDDLMHDLFLGVARDVGASVIVDLLESQHLVDEHGDPFNSKQDALDVIGLELREFCRQHELKRPPCAFTMANLGREKETVYPELGSSFKAAHNKIIMSFLAHLTYKLGLNDRRSKIRATMCYSLASFLRILDHSGRF